MKKRLCIISIFFIILIMLFVGCAPSSTSPTAPEPADKPQEEPQEDVVKMAPVNLRLAHFWSATHFVETDIVQLWAEEVERATNGLVTVTSYPGGTLLGANDIYGGVEEGIADLGISFFTYTRGRFPMVEIFELPGTVYNNCEVAAKVIWEYLKEMNPEEVQDTKIMFAGSGGLADLATKTPVRTLEDLQGMEIRTTGASALPITVLGGVPVSLPMSDSYEALSKGVVKGILGPPSPLQTWKLSEVVDYVTLTPFLYTSGWFFTMNLNTWNSLPAEIQTAIKEINEKIHEDVVLPAFRDADEKGLKYAIEQEKVEILTLTKEETERWVNISRATRDEHILIAEGQGLPAKKASDLIEQLAKKYNEIYK